MVLAACLVMMMVALATPASLISWIEPLTLPERFCAVRRRAAKGGSNEKARNGTRNFVLADRVRRLMDGLSMAAKPRSRIEGQTVTRRAEQSGPGLSAGHRKATAWVTSSASGATEAE